MPRLLKTIIGIFILYVVLGIVSLNPYDPNKFTQNIFWIVLNMAVLVGFRTKSKIAWHIARVIKVIGIAGSIVLLVLLFMSLFSKGSFILLIFFIVAIASLALELFVFFALGTTDVRKYFGTEKRNTHHN